MHNERKGEIKLLGSHLSESRKAGHVIQGLGLGKRV